MKATTNKEAAVAGAWVRLGVMLNAREAEETPDVERLLLDTARLAGGNSRLFTGAGTWLDAYGGYVAAHRLARLVRDELETEHWATLGLMLEWSAGGEARFKGVIALCGERLGETVAGPLANAERRSAMLTKLSKERSALLSRNWKRWASESTLTVRPEILRGVEWVTERNGGLAIRALLTDAATSIVAAFSPGVIVESKALVARGAGLDRLPASQALDLLRAAGMVRFRSEGRREAVEFLAVVAA